MLNTQWILHNLTLRLQWRDRAGFTPNFPLSLTYGKKPICSIFIFLFSIREYNIDLVVCKMDLLLNDTLLKIEEEKDWIPDTYHRFLFDINLSGLFIYNEH